MIKIIQTLSDFQDLEETWKTLEASAKIFQTFDWVYLGWTKFHCQEKENPNRLWILVWTREESGDTVIFPWFIDAKGCLRFIMDTHSDNLDAVYAHDGRNRFNCYKEVAEAIRAERRIKTCHFQKLVAQSEVLHYLGGGGILKPTILYRDNAFSYLSLQKSDDIFRAMTHMRKKDRAHLKILMRRSEPYRLEILSHQKNDDFPIGDVLFLRQHMLEHTARTIGFLPDTLIAFVKALYERGRVEIVCLRAEARPVALAFRLVKDNRILAWIFLYTDAHAPTMVHVRYMAEKLKLQDAIFDFGVGVYDYKLGTFRPQIESSFSVCYAKTFCGWVRLMIKMNWRYAKDYYKVLRRKIS